MREENLLPLLLGVLNKFPVFLQSIILLRKLRERKVSVIAVYIDMDKFFDGIDMKIDDFGGVGFTIELLKHYGIRACELGPFAFEWDMACPT